jgi:drug/metabolite transporter (DMT)-like permease
MNYFFPPILIISGLVLYQISQKSVDKDANPFIVVAVAYFIGILACVAGYFLLPRQDAELLPMIKTIAWSALGIGIGAAAIEFGFLLAYRAGWDVSILPLSANVFSALILILIGVFAYRESLSVEKFIGVLMCIGGLILITVKK